MTSAGLFGVGEALPPDTISNADLEATLDTTDAWIVKRTGIRERHWLNGRQTLADLATEAAGHALADAGRDGGQVDHVIVATIAGDHVTPGLAPEVAARIGAHEAAAHDLNAACAGFLYALDEAAALVETGRAGLVVVCAAEALSRVTDHDDRATGVLFGDGSGAVVVGPGEELALGCPAFTLGSDGVSKDLLHTDTEHRCIRMQGRAVYRHAVRRMTEATQIAVSRAGLEPADVDLFVFHQANARIVEAAADELGIAPEKVVSDVARVANTSSASIPLALSRAQRDGRLRPGMRVALAAFGAGFVWGAGVVSWKERAPVYA